MTEAHLHALLEPYLGLPEAAGFVPPPNLYSQLGVYLELLLRWNARTNLTAVRGPENIVLRHFGESLFTAVHLQAYIHPGATLLDLGSGAGFPGLPIQLCFPDLPVTLAESQGKKAAFLREAVRVLGLKTEVWAGRAESMPPERRFGVVTLRAVDCMDIARTAAESRLTGFGLIAELTTVLAHTNGPAEAQIFHVPGSDQRTLCLWRKGI